MSSTVKKVLAASIKGSDRAKIELLATFGRVLSSGGSVYQASKCIALKEKHRAPRSSGGLRADKAASVLYYKGRAPLETYISGYTAAGKPIVKVELDTAGRVMLPGERGTIKKNRSMPRSAASKHGGAGAKNKLRASAMVDQFLVDAANQKREIASVKANAVIAHFAGVDVETLPRKQRQSARRALRKAFANL